MALFTLSLCLPFKSSIVLSLITFIISSLNRPLVFYKTRDSLIKKRKPDTSKNQWLLDAKNFGISALSFFNDNTSFSTL